MSHSKKIVFKVSEFPHLSETFIVAQIVTAIKLGYEVQILIKKLVDNGLAINSGLIDEYRLIDKVIIEDYAVPKNKLIRFIRWGLLLLSNLKNLFAIVRFHKELPRFSLTCLYQWDFYQKFNDDAIFHVQYGTSSKPLDILKKTGFKPSLVVTFHGHDAFFPINGFIPNNGYYDNLFKYSDLITANTPYLGNKVIDLGCPKNILSIIPVGVDTKYFYPNKEIKATSKTLKLITVGRLDKVKGHDYCVRILANLINQGIDVTLTIIGEGKERKALENLITKHQVADKVFMKGKKTQFEVRAELWEHDVYLLTATALPDGRRETQGLATLEAQACGLPAIVFDSGGVKYTVDHGVSGFVCDEFDVDGAVDSILKLIESPKLLFDMSAEAIKFTEENFSQEKIDNKWRTIYNKLCNAK